MDEEFKKALVEFIEWVKIKVRIHISDVSCLSFKQREVWWASIGLNVGSEQNGKDVNFQRPVLILRKFGQQMFWAIPLTSKRKDSQFHLEIRYKEYSENILGELIGEEKSGIVILNQLKTMSSKRLVRKMGVMSEQQFDTVRERLRDIL